MTARRDRVIATPRARRALRLRGLDGAGVSGSGLNGRILAADVANFVEPAVTSAPASTTSAATAYLRAEIDASRMYELFEKHSAGVSIRHGVSMSLTDFMLAALAAGVPESAFSIGLATDHGILPIVAGSNLLQTARYRTASSIDEMGSASVVLYNAGAGRIDEWAPDIPAGSFAALGAGSIAYRPFASGPSLSTRRTLKLCLAYNAGAISSASAIAWLNDIATALEEPESLLFS